MGMESSQMYRAPDCPGCGKPDAARFCRSTWGHDISCCSDICGERVRDALREMHDTPHYQFLTALLHDTESRLSALQWETIKEARELVAEAT